jgi:hypothetical protein
MVKLIKKDRTGFVLDDTGPEAAGQIGENA